VAAVSALPGLAAGRDALERDFTEQVATPFNTDFRLTEACMAPMQATLTI
jgi:hypothetical protein